jgi:hypothetical protein
MTRKTYPQLTRKLPATSKSSLPNPVTVNQLGTRLVKRIRRGRRGLKSGGPRRSADKRKGGRDGGNSEIERAERRRFGIRGSRLSYVAAGSPGGVREFSVAGSFNSRPFDSGSDLKLKFNGVFVSSGEMTQSQDGVKSQLSSEIPVYTSVRL